MTNNEFLHSISSIEDASKDYAKKNAFVPEDSNDGDIPMYERVSAEQFRDGAEYVWQIFNCVADRFRYPEVEEMLTYVEEILIKLRP